MYYFIVVRGGFVTGKYIEYSAHKFYAILNW